MKNLSYKIRFATTEDSQSILAIYSEYVKNTAISFELEVPTVDEFTKRIEDIIEKYPYLVYLIDNKIVGYAYASKHRERAAYGYNVDVSVYFSAKYHGSGAASQLYACLFQLLKAQGFYNAYAAYTEPNEKSLNLHKKFGFEYIGTYHKVGYKLGKWHDVTWLEKIIQVHDSAPSKVKLITELSEEFVGGVLQ